MSDERSSHPLNQPSQAAHPLNDHPPQMEKPKGVQIPIPLNANFPLITYGLIVINVAIFALRYLAPALSNEILFYGYTDPIAVIQGREFYRLFTSMFLHLNEAHMFFNGLALYYIGSHLERLFGHVRFALIYFLGGLAGSILPLFFGTGGLGASGAVFAIWAAEVVFLYQNRQIFGAAGRSRIQSSMMMMLVNFMIGFSANALADVAGGVRIGNAAHFGGLVGGAVLAWLIAPKFLIKRKSIPEEGNLSIEIVQSNQLKDKVQAILLFCLALLGLLIFAIFLGA